MLHQVVQRFGEELVGTGQVLLAVTEQHTGPLVERRPCRCAREGRLAYSGLAGQENDLPAAVGRHPFVHVSEDAQLVVATDQANGGTSSKPTRKRDPSRHGHLGLRNSGEGSALRRDVQVRGLFQDGELQGLECRAGVDTQFLGKQLARLTVDGQSVCLSARSVQGHHEQTPEGFIEGVTLDQPLEFARDLAVATECEVGFDPAFDGGHPQVLQPGHRRQSRHSEIEAVENGTAPEPQCLGEACRHRLMVLAGLDFRETLELSGVELAGRGVEDIAGRPGPQTGLAVRGRAEQLAKSGDVHLQRIERLLRRVVSPGGFDQPVTRDDAVRLEQQGAQDDPIHAALGQQGSSFLPEHFQRPQDPEAHAALERVLSAVRGHAQSVPGPDLGFFCPTR